jgi:cell division septation protein DedD
MTRYLAPLAALLLGIPALAAQSSTVAPPADSATTSDTLFLRAQRMAAEGQGDAARALVQRELDTAAAGSPHYVDALYWRAVVAATAADAERDLRRIIIEFPLSRRSEDALLRLAQLEMTRGDNDQALAHLQRLVLEHPTSAARARASFWMARVYFDKNDAPAACRTLADAERSTAPAQVEQRNQIDFWMQRCRGVDTAAVASTAPSASSSTPPSSASDTSPAPPPAPVTAPPRTAPPRAPAASSHAAAGRTQYTVQVAAYATHSAAEALRKSLVARGFEARIAGASKPYRVRVGRYDTRDQADAAARTMKGKGIAVYVTEAEPR